MEKFTLPCAKGTTMIDDWNEHEDSGEWERAPFAECMCIGCLIGAVLVISVAAIVTLLT